MICINYEHEYNWTNISFSTIILWNETEWHSLFTSTNNTYPSCLALVKCIFQPRYNMPSECLQDLCTCPCILWHDGWWMLMMIWWCLTISANPQQSSIRYRHLRSIGSFGFSVIDFIRVTTKPIHLPHTNAHADITLPLLWHRLVTVQLDYSSPFHSLAFIFETAAPQSLHFPILPRRFNL